MKSVKTATGSHHFNDINPFVSASVSHITSNLFRTHFDPGVLADTLCSSDVTVDGYRHKKSWIDVGIKLHRFLIPLNVPSPPMAIIALTFFLFMVSAALF